MRRTMTERARGLPCASTVASVAIMRRAWYSASTRRRSSLIQSAMSGLYGRMAAEARMHTIGPRSAHERKCERAGAAGIFAAVSIGGAAAWARVWIAAVGEPADAGGALRCVCAVVRTGGAIDL